MLLLACRAARGATELTLCSPLDCAGNPSRGLPSPVALPVALEASPPKRQAELSSSPADASAGKRLRGSQGRPSPGAARAGGTSASEAHVTHGALHTPQPSVCSLRGEAGSGGSSAGNAALDGEVFSLLAASLDKVKAAKTSHIGERARRESVRGAARACGCGAPRIYVNIRCIMKSSFCLTDVLIETE